MLTDELIKENLDRINSLIRFAEAKGDDAPVVGTILILAMTDEEFENFLNPAFSTDVVEVVATRLDALGVKA